MRGLHLALSPCGRGRRRVLHEREWVRGTPHPTWRMPSPTEPPRRAAPAARPDRERPSTTTALAASSLTPRPLRRGLHPAQHRLARGARFVEAAARRVIRRAGEACRVAALRRHRQIAQRGDELVERGLALRLGRLDQHRAVHHQREIHRHRVIALVDHRLGEIERGDAGAFEPVIVEQHLVHAGPVAERRDIRSLEPGADVVGVEHGILARLPHAVGAVASM